MPKGRKGFGGKGGKGMDKAVLIPFRNLVSLTFGASAGQVIQETDLVVGNLGARVAAMATAFEWFRFKSLRAYQYTDFGASVYDGSSKVGQINASHALAWVDSNAAATGTATNILQMSQYEKFQTGSLYQRLSVRMSSKELGAVPYKWYGTTATGMASDETSPGMFIQAAATGISTNSPNAAVLVFEGVVELRGMITPALQSVFKPDDKPFDPICAMRGLSMKQEVDSSSGVNITAPAVRGMAESPEHVPDEVEIRAAIEYLRRRRFPVALESK